MVVAPYWVKVVRSGSTFSGYSSADGITWDFVGSDTINMTTSVFVGMALTSHNDLVLEYGHHGQRQRHRRRTDGDAHPDRDAPGR